MRTYLMKRLAGSMLSLVGVALVVFLILHLSPGDPAEIMTIQGASAEQVERLRAQMGLDRPLLVQFAIFSGRLVTGDLGVSLYTDESVLDMIRDRLGVTISIAVGGLFLSVLAGVPGGIVAAVRKDTPFDYGVMILSLLGLCVPVFTLGPVLMLLFSVYLDWFPISGIKPLSEGLAPYVLSMALPWISLGFWSLGVVMRLVRSSVLEELSYDYVRTARAKGLRERTIIYGHVLRNAMVPVITVVGLQLGSLLGGAVLTESVFSLPGVGRMMVRAITMRDYPVVQGSLIIVSAMFVITNLLVDLSYSLVDPRIHYQ